jgi:tagaturonate reductase
MERFRNPFLDHQWISITVQYSSKMKMRNVPLLVKYYSKQTGVPEHMALGFAAYLLFMKCNKNIKGKCTNQVNGVTYEIQDDHAPYFAEKWNSNDVDEVVDRTLADSIFWGADLSMLIGFAEAVKIYLRSLMRNGVMATVRRVDLNKTVV